MPLHTEILTARDAIDALAPAWDALVHEEPQTLAGLDGTMGFAWFDALRTAFPAAATPSVVVCRDGPEVLGLLPLAELGRNLLGTQLGLPTELYGGRCAPLLAQGRPGLLEALLRELARSRTDWATLQMTVLTGSPIAEQLRDCGSRLGWRWTEQVGNPTVHFPLAPADQPLRQSLPANAWQNLRKAQNRAARLGDRLVVREFSAPEQAQALLEAVLAVEHGTWKHEAGSAITNNPQQQAFYAALFPRAMREGVLLGLVLYLDGQPVAHHFGLLRQGTFCGLKHSHVKSQDALSPSNLLMAEMLQRLRQNGAQTFDCMGVVEPHKLRWSLSNASYQRSTFILYNGTGRAKALLALRQGAKQSRRLAEALPMRRKPAATPPADGGTGPADTRLELMAPGPELAALGPQWDALVRDDPTELQGMDMSSGYCWFEALTRSRGQAEQARVLVKRRGTELLGVLPLVLRARTPLGSQLQVATELYGGRNGLLMNPRDSASVTEMLQGLAQAYPDWVTLDCSLCQDGESLHLLLEAAADLGMTVQQQVMPATPYVALLDTAERFNAGVSRSALRNMRSSQRRAAALGQLNYREFRDPQDADAMLAMLLAVECQSWKHEAGTAITARPEQEAFYRSLAAPAMRQGLLYVLALYLDDQPISYQLGLMRDGVYSCLKNSMVKAHADLRPSYLIKAELFDRLRAMGVRTVDLMGVAEPHKLVWSPTTPSYQRVQLTLYRRTLAGRVLAQARRFKSRFNPKPAPLTQSSDEALTVS